jgi:hypothetical protein
MIHLADTVVVAEAAANAVPFHMLAAAADPQVIDRHGVPP